MSWSRRLIPPMALFFLSAPVAAQESMDVDLSYSQFTLENGLNVLVHEDRSLPLVSVNLWYHVGSKNERPGRTGFAHLFEHVMFEGSANVPEGDFDNLLESVGGINNGSTSPDRTNYWETVPSNALELALWLEADRMGWLLDAMDEEKLDVQRSVVMNERRQSYENRPYGLAFERVLAELYPEHHPYHWPTIGSMADLEAATLEDVSQFFRTYYVPGNASLAIAGDVTLREVRELVDKYFAEIPAGAPVPEVAVSTPVLDSDRRVTLEDDVQLPRLYMAWHTPATFDEGDAALDVLGSLLSDGKSSRLYRELVYEAQIAQDVSAGQRSGELSSVFLIVATAKPGSTLQQLEQSIRAELERVATQGVTHAELSRAVTGIEADFVRSLERVGGFGGKADRLNRYYFETGDPGFTRRDLGRFRALGTSDVQQVAREYLTRGHGVVLSVVPTGRLELAAQDSSR